MGPMSKLWISLVLMTTSACSFSRGGSPLDEDTPAPSPGGDDGGRPDAGEVDVVGGDEVDAAVTAPVDAVCTGEIVLPREIRMQCGDRAIPLVAAFRAANGDGVRFARMIGRPHGCPFRVQGAELHAAELDSCAPFVALAEDAEEKAGVDRLEVTWCWFAAGAEADDEGCCQVSQLAASVECVTQQVDLVYACDGGVGLPAGSDQPLAGASCPIDVGVDGGDRGDVGGND